MRETDWEAFGRRLMDRVERDGALHLSSIVDEGKAFEATCAPPVARSLHIADLNPDDLFRGEQVAELAKKLLDHQRGGGRVLIGPNHARVQGGGGASHGIHPRIKYTGIDPGHGVDRTVILCAECGTRHTFLASEKMRTECLTCGAPFEGKERP